ncbi:hypothetical protein RSOL_432210 [Rhizoctonia solani AG-3 Rhs1AP]|uniref:Uncharacterized protein n=1 Tax=Rhizoctonia solani AG-3 Rhs1AP TaxID=1086054 RepID=X8JL12_9AGAM|nr:hypothetical protein RSOL_432210 [Rhizoctonia solani AG-3 Rhs1AP]
MTLDPTLLPHTEFCSSTLARSIAQPGAHRGWARWRERTGRRPLSLHEEGACTSTRHSLAEIFFLIGTTCHTTLSASYWSPVVGSDCAWEWVLAHVGLDEMDVTLFTPFAPTRTLPWRLTWRTVENVWRGITNHCWGHIYCANFSV